ncbi:MAG: diguanylate cyclase [Phascolarctobacterium sp.]
MKKALNLNYTRKVHITVVVILMLLVLSGFMSYQIGVMEEETAWASLKRSANRVDEELSRRVEIDREVLLTLAGIISKQEQLDGPVVREIVNEFQANSLMGHIGLLLPGDRLIWPHREIMDVRGKLSFEQEAAHGTHITNRLKDLETGKNYILRNFVPVTRDGKTVAMLYGRVNLDTLPAFMNQNLYQGKALYFIIDGSTGDFILNTNRKQLGNMWDVPERAIKSGDSSLVLKEKLRLGQEGRTIIQSAFSGEYGCFYYMPASINQWRVGVFVPEDIALAKASKTSTLLVIFLACQLLLLASYFIWLERTSRKELAEQQRLAERDLLTGCLNRNSFENKLQEPDLSTKHVSSIYIDVNGLHELNNTQGHAAGDKMLQTVAALTRTQFGNNNVYRIGGDEFVVLVVDMEDVQVNTALRTLVDRIHRAGYFVSVGQSCSHGERSIDELIKDAETHMYEDKRRFYSEQGRDRRNHR